jgi:tetratricopeptide (TPR) repeat protein
MKNAVKQGRRPDASPVRPSCGWARTIAGLSFLAIMAGLSVAATAHDSPEHVIEGLSAQIEAAGKRPDLLWRRATEYRALGDLQSAARDLRAALAVRDDFAAARQDLALLELAQGKTGDALRTIDRAFRSLTNAVALAPLRMVRAEILYARGQFEKALTECEAALQCATGSNLDWYLTRAQMQRRLGRFNDAAIGLKQAFEQTGSAVFEAEWIDAMIDAGQYAAALQRIEPQLAEARCQSSWLLRRARVRLSQGEITAAHHDLQKAITEISQRLGGLVPESSLLADRSLAYALLGDAVLAKRDLNAARKGGADETALRRIEAVLSGRG